MLRHKQMCTSHVMYETSEEDEPCNLELSVMVVFTYSELFGYSLVLQKRFKTKFTITSGSDTKLSHPQLTPRECPC